MGVGTPVGLTTMVGSWTGADAGCCATASAQVSDRDARIVETRTCDRHAPHRLAARMEEVMIRDLGRDVSGTSPRTKSPQRSRRNLRFGYCRLTPTDMLARDHG